MPCVSVTLLLAPQALETAPPFGSGTARGLVQFAAAHNDAGDGVFVHDPPAGATTSVTLVGVAVQRSRTAGELARSKVLLNPRRSRI